MRIREILSEAKTVTWNDIWKLNPDIKDPNKIYVDQQIKLPGTNDTHTVQRGDTLSKIAQLYNMGAYGEGKPVVATQAAAPAVAAPAPVAQVKTKQGAAPDGSVLPAAVIPWATTFPQFAGRDMVKTNGAWRVKNGTASQYANQPLFIKQLEDLWAQQP